MWPSLGWFYFTLKCHHRHIMAKCDRYLYIIKSAFIYSTVTVHLLLNTTQTPQPNIFCGNKKTNTFLDVGCDGIQTGLDWIGRVRDWSTDLLEDDLLYLLSHSRPKVRRAAHSIYEYTYSNNVLLLHSVIIESVASMTTEQTHLKHWLLCCQSHDLLSI